MLWLLLAVQLTGEKIEERGPQELERVRLCVQYWGSATVYSLAPDHGDWVQPPTMGATEPYVSGRMWGSERRGVCASYITVRTYLSNHGHTLL